MLFNNLSYTALNPHEPADRRLSLLERDGDGYVPYAYEQLAAAYRHGGDEGAARRVQLAKLRRHRATLPWLGRTWGHLQDTTVGYGFRPLRAAVWLLSLLAVGSIAFALRHPSPLNADEAPQFNPVFYTLDLLLPVISFGQEGAFAPTGRVPVPVVRPHPDRLDPGHDRYRRGEQERRPAVSPVSGNSPQWRGRCACWAASRTGAFWAP